MDRQRALEQLEVVRANSDDMSDSELAAAVTAMDSDPSARQEFERRLQLDQKIGAEMRKVAVPEGLREKLLAAIAEPPAQIAPVENVSIRYSRRPLLIGALSMALLVAAGVAFRWMGPMVSYDEIVDAAPRNGDQIAKLMGDSASGELSLGFDLPGWLARKEIAQQMTWPNENSRLANGSSKSTSYVCGGGGWALVVTPLSAVTDLPGFDKGGTISKALGPALYQGAWRDEQYVYVLFVAGGKRDFDRLRTRLVGTTA